MSRPISTSSRSRSLPTYIVLPADHRFAQRRSLALAEIVEEPFILLDMPLSREYFVSLFLRNGLTPNIVARSDYPETVRSYVASGFGFSLLTARPVNKAALNGLPLAYVRLEGEYEPMVLGIATLRGLRKPRTAQAFIDYCRATISTERLPGTASWPRLSRLHVARPPRAHGPAPRAYGSAPSQGRGPTQA